MSAPGTIERPDVESGETAGGPHFVVVVYNNDHNSMDEVIEILILATACSFEEAEMETWEVHHLGKSVVHHGAQDECDDVADVIRQIGIRVEVCEE